MSGKWNAFISGESRENHTILYAGYASVFVTFPMRKLFENFMNIPRQSKGVFRGGPRGVTSAVNRFRASF